MADGAVTVSAAARMYLVGSQPVFLRQAEHRSAHHALVEAERGAQSDETAKPSASAMVRDGIAVNRDDDRLCLRLE